MQGTIRNEARGLRAIAPKQFKPPQTDSRHDLRISPNLLRNNLNTPTSKAEVIVGDITYLPLRSGGFCYLAAFQDKFTRRIVGWQVSARMTAQLVMDAFGQACKGGHLKRGAIIHTDQGSQYAAVEYRRLSYIGGFRQSMSHKGNCYDNAMADAFLFPLQSRISRGRRV